LWALSFEPASSGTGALLSIYTAGLSIQVHVFEIRPRFDPLLDGGQPLGNTVLSKADKADTLGLWTMVAKSAAWP